MNRSILSAAIVSLGLAATSYAAPVYSGPLNTPLLANFNGTYLNLVNGTVVNGLPNFPAGSPLDINIWVSAAPPVGWKLFANSNGALADGGIAVSSDFFGALLNSGQLVGPASTFSISADVTTANVAGTNIYGVRFLNEAGPNTIHYGWVQLNLTPGSSGVATGTLLGYGFESTPNTAIVAGAGIPEPTTLAVLGAAAAFVLRRRRA